MSEATPETPAVTTPPEGEAKTFDADYVEKLRKENAKYRTEAKANADAAKRLADLEESTKTETQKAIDAARSEADKAARADMTREFARKLASAEIKAALTGLVPDPAAIVEDLNLDRYVTDDGDIDPSAVAALREKYAALATPGRPRGDADQGPRGDVLALNGDPLLDTVKNLLGTR